VNAGAKTSGATVRVPAHISAFVEVLGVDGAVDFLLQFGGGYSYFSADPDPASPVAAAIGVDKATALAGRLGTGTVRIPTAKPFIARVLSGRRMGTSAIARRLHMSDVAVRRWLKEEDPRQMTLFDLPPPVSRTPF
jgi:hypothetical protein